MINSYLSLLDRAEEVISQTMKSESRATGLQFGEMNGTGLRTWRSRPGKVMSPRRRCRQRHPEVPTALCSLNSHGALSLWAPRQPPTGHRVTALRSSARCPRVCHGSPFHLNRLSFPSLIKAHFIGYETITT